MIDYFLMPFKQEKNILETKRLHKKYISRTSLAIFPKLTTIAILMDYQIFYN